MKPSSSFVDRGALRIYYGSFDECRPRRRVKRRWDSRRGFVWIYSGENGERERALATRGCRFINVNESRLRSVRNAMRVDAKNECKGAFCATGRTADAGRAGERQPERTLSTGHWLQSMTVLTCKSDPSHTGT